ncbi:MAG: uroporphyrinogen-III synthase [Bacteroidales bacterium]|nr:uroporphyrinogen-III synthase [Bacteroidales bacterium]
MPIKNILISQPKPIHRSPYDDLVKKYDITVDFRKFFDIEPLPAREFRKARIDLASFTSVIFTSKVAIDHYFRLSEELRFLIPSTMKYFCMNETIANYLNKYIVYRKRKISFADGNVDDLVNLLSKYPEEKYLLPVADSHKNTLSNKLKRKKLKVVKAVSYKIVSSDLTDLGFDYDIVVLFSPSGVKALQENFPNYNSEKSKIAAFGAETCKAVTKAGYKLEIKAPTSEHPSMTMALDTYLKKNEGK